jgi:hypothetical protein
MKISEDKMRRRIFIEKLLMRAAWKFDGFADDALPQQTAVRLTAAPQDPPCMK